LTAVRSLQDAVSLIGLLERADSLQTADIRIGNLKMKLSLRPGLFGICAMSALAAVMGGNLAHGQGYNHWGVFRERSLLGQPVDQRRCQIEEIGSNEFAVQEILARVATRVEAASIYRFLVKRVQCAP
jgi:hypothetical protein